MTERTRNDLATDICLFDSPKINPDLLQRSEVVALFNTLHRVSESLAAIESFRTIYAETQKSEKEVARQRALKDEEVNKILLP